MQTADSCTLAFRSVGGKPGERSGWSVQPNLAGLSCEETLMGEPLRTRREALLGALGLGAVAAAGCNNTVTGQGGDDDDSGPFDGLPLNAKAAGVATPIGKGDAGLWARTERVV